MKNIYIDYFALLREITGLASEALQTDANTPSDLYDQLLERYKFPVQSSLKVAINDEFSSWDVKLSDGDRIVFIPPVAGG